MFGIFFLILQAHKIVENICLVHNKVKGYYDRSNFGPVSNWRWRGLACEKIWLGPLHHRPPGQISMQNLLKSDQTEQLWWSEFWKRELCSMPRVYPCYHLVTHFSIQCFTLNVKISPKLNLSYMQVTPKSPKLTMFLPV